MARLRKTTTIAFVLLVILTSGVSAEPVKKNHSSTPTAFIPEGKFILGTSKQGADNFVVTLEKTYGAETIELDVFDNAIYDRPVRLSAYRIDIYPVTVAQYAAFLNSGGGKHYHPEMAEAQKCGIKKSEIGYQVIPGRENYPVVYVNWFDATAYAAWHRTGRLP